MATLTAGQRAPLSADEASVQLRRAVIAATVGTTIEWYDFFLYSIVTGLVFAKLYFPQSDPLTGTLEAFGVYAIGFVARPVGAAIFGHWGGRIPFVISILLIGVGLWIRLGIMETPTFQRLVAENRIEKAPAVEVIR